MENIKDCKIKIRKMNLEDLESISNILYSDFDDFWSYDVFASELCSDNSSYFVALRENEIIGFAGFKIICDETEIMNIVVRKSARSIGVGSLLMEHLLFEVHNKGASTVNLEVDSNNSVAIKLYEKFGFKKVGFRKGYYGDANAGAILMTL